MLKDEPEQEIVAQVKPERKEKTHSSTSGSPKQQAIVTDGIWIPVKGN